MSPEILDGRIPHSRVRLDAKYAIAVLEKHLRRQPRTAADIGDYRIARKSTMFAQIADDLTRIIRPVFRVIRDAV